MRPHPPCHKSNSKLDVIQKLSSEEVQQEQEQEQELEEIEERGENDVIKTEEIELEEKDMLGYIYTRYQGTSCGRDGY